MEAVGASAEHAHFDAPTREKCAIRRPRTNTPLQALVTLNDVQFVEAARFLAQRTIKEAQGAPESRIEHLYRLVLGRKPKPAEQNILLGVYRDNLSRFKADLDVAAKLLAFGESKRDESIDAADHAAWTLIASMILNCDETLTKG